MSRACAKEDWAATLDELSSATSLRAGEFGAFFFVFWRSASLIWGANFAKAQPKSFDLDRTRLPEIPFRLAAGEPALGRAAF